MRLTGAVMALALGTGALLWGTVQIALADGSCTGNAFVGGIICSGSCPADPGKTCAPQTYVSQYSTLKWCGCRSDLVGVPCCSVTYFHHYDGSPDTFGAAGDCGPGAGDPNCPVGNCTPVEEPSGIHKGRCK